MPTPKHYPNYSTYTRAGKTPTVLNQRFPRPAVDESESYYPIENCIAKQFTDPKEAWAFGAESFCAFLADTIDVELCVVIPAVASLRRIPVEIPPEPKQDLFKTATDEGFHAEQSLQFLSDLRHHLGLPNLESSEPPLFLRRLEEQRAVEPNPVYRNLIMLLNGIVTETRISVELSRFSLNDSLAPSVREICGSHAQDEAIHSSQFRALGAWLWEALDHETKLVVARFLNASIIARSLPDLDRYIEMFRRATGRSQPDSAQRILSVYDTDKLVQEMTIAAHPTIAFIKQLGTGNYEPFESALEAERRRLDKELDTRRAMLRV